MSTTSRGRELTVREAARRVHRAEETIRRWIWTGKLPARKLGTGYQVQERDLDAIAGAPAPRDPAESELRLGEWVAAVKAWRAGNDVLPHGGAGQFVIEDRAELPISLHADPADRHRAWDLARRYDNHPIYDMLYVALAERLGEPLVTVDDKLRRRLALEVFSDHMTSTSRRS